MITRKQYINNEATHSEYYGQFVTPSILSLLDHNRIKTSNDIAFNDINLNYWERLATHLPHTTINQICDANKSTHNGKGTYSLSDCVCVLKAAARQIRGY